MYIAAICFLVIAPLAYLLRLFLIIQRTSDDPSIESRVDFFSTIYLNFIPTNIYVLTVLTSLLIGV